MKQQRGIALVASILLLLILTLVAVSLAQNSRSSSQLAVASMARDEALQLANGGQENFVEGQRLARGTSVLITNSDTTTVVDGTLGVNNDVVFIIESSCRRARNATASGVINCRQSDVESTIRFGRNHRGNLSVTAGVEQPVLKMGGG
ncbi:PilX N-terminal domain-containing pilus assembly protein [uncultured Ferrimonas sp.]|uniref:PilX N-terminal domain-containing pilus assembly protein n=1 Tax=uncultured Ferrimonas sp. TaxID=432640 RepID=UPI0026314C01|nr:PilX N-terminal domain-containing pilus assembly protein [uncultured Ferrimonas sp.]